MCVESRPVIRDHRRPQCSGYGENSRVTFLRVNMVAAEGDDDYCGVFGHAAQFPEGKNNVRLDLKILKRKLKVLGDKISCTVGSVDCFLRICLIFIVSFLARRH